MAEDPALHPIFDQVRILEKTLSSPVDPPSPKMAAQSVIDLTTRVGALDFLNYSSPDLEARVAHDQVNIAFQRLMDELWDSLPAGPGKTVAIRAIGLARMHCNQVIATRGA